MRNARCLGYLLCLASLSTPALATPPDSFEMRPLAVLPFHPDMAVSCGDADHDGRQEMVLKRSYEHSFLCEHRGGDEFDTVPMPWMPEGAVTWCIHDPDMDGLADLVCQMRTVAFVMAVGLFESRDSSSLPDSLVWLDSIPEMPGYTWTLVSDLDADSVPEVLARDETEGAIRVYENRGDNDYELIAQLAMVYPPAGQHARLCETHDLDGDGCPELASGADNGWLTLYESVMNDSFTPLRLFQVGGSGDQCRALAAGPDIDRDGKPELLAFFVGPDDVGHLRVFESPEDDSFEVVVQEDRQGSYWGSEGLAVGDLNGDSVPEVVLDDGYAAVVYQCTGNDQYEVAWTSIDYFQPSAIYDINSDGRDELICRSGWEETTVLAYGPASLAECGAARLRTVEVLPSVLRPGARLRLTGLPAGAKVELLDSSGRVRHTTTSSLSPGLFFVRVTSGTQSDVRKLLVVD